MMSFRIIPRPSSARSMAITGATALLVLSALGGCASTPVPVAQMAVAEAAVQRASTSSTSESAAIELRVATDKLAAARSAVTNGDSKRARYLAEQAELDAQVAEIHAQAVRSSKAAQESDAAARALRDEVNRKTVR